MEVAEHTGESWPVASWGSVSSAADGPSTRMSIARSRFTSPSTFSSFAVMAAFSWRVVSSSITVRWSSFICRDVHTHGQLETRPVDGHRDCCGRTCAGSEEVESSGFHVSSSAMLGFSVDRQASRPPDLMLAGSP